MYWPVLNADFVLSFLEMVKVGNSVFHPVLIITLGEVLAGVRASALLDIRHMQISTEKNVCNIECVRCSLLCTRALLLYILKGAGQTVAV